jgi:hypothetical protein
MGSPVVTPRVALELGREPTAARYAGGQKKNQAVSATETRAAVKLPLIWWQRLLTVRQKLVVATAASVATTTNASTNARASSRKIMSIMNAP